MSKSINPMTIGQLIEELKKLPSNNIAIVSNRNSELCYISGIESEVMKS